MIKYTFPCSPQVDRDKNKVQIFSYTRAEWLDVVEIEFYPGQFSGTEGNVRYENIHTGI